MSRLFAALSLLLVLLGPLAGTPAWADEPPAGPAPAKAEAPEAPGLTTEALDDAFAERPDLVLFVGATKYGALVVGLVLLVLAYLRHDRIRGGILPAPARTSPPELFPPGTALLLALGGSLALPFFLTLVLVLALGSAAVKGPLTIGIMTVSLLPVGLIVGLRRLRAVPDAPRLPQALGHGLWAFCVASALVVPLTLLTVLVLQALGQPTPVQELVRQVVQAEGELYPATIAVYGVLIAPFVEECVFRALLYPACRRWFGGTRKASVGSAVAVSLLFAAVHGSATAFLGLFALALVLTWVYERTNSLAAVVTGHAVNNIVSLAPILLLRWT